MRKSKTTETQSSAAPGIIALSAWLKGLGRSDTTGWRWAQAGFIHPINICGRPYLTAEDIAQFQARAKAGEFAKANSGAARRSAEQRAVRQKEESQGNCP